MHQPYFVIHHRSLGDAVTTAVTRRAHRTFEVRRSEGLSAGGHAVRLALRRWAHRTLGCLHLVEWLLAQRCEVMRSAMHRWRASTAGRRLHCRAGMRDLLWA